MLCLLRLPQALQVYSARYPTALIAVPCLPSCVPGNREPVVIYPFAYASCVRDEEGMFRSWRSISCLEQGQGEHNKRVIADAAVPSAQKMGSP